VFAILCGASGRHHEVDFEDGPVIVNVPMSPTAVQITMTAADITEAVRDWPDDFDDAVVEDEELEGIEIESTHTIEIDSFVPRCEIDQLFFDTPYYITPNDPVGQEAFAVIREAMRSKDLVALGRIVLSKREPLGPRIAPRHIGKT
jgi:Ku protein